MKMDTSLSIPKNISDPLCSVCYESLDRETHEDIVNCDITSTTAADTICDTTSTTDNITTICDHTFHIKCLNTWLDSRNDIESQTCPLCRSRVVMGPINRELNLLVLDDSYLHDIFTSGTQLRIESDLINSTPEFILYELFHEYFHRIRIPELTIDNLFSSMTIHMVNDVLYYADFTTDDRSIQIHCIMVFSQFICILQFETTIGNYTYRQLLYI
jgi:hypothetical protein